MDEKGKRVAFLGWFALGAVVLSGCSFLSSYINGSTESGNSSSSASSSRAEVEHPHCRFFDWDKTLLWETNVEKGASVTYQGKTPSRAADARYTYTFKGWDQSLNDLRYDTDFIAQYDAKGNVFSVHFKNWDGSDLSSVNAEYGSYASYGGATPIRDPDAHYSYLFKGWDRDPSSTRITGDTNFFAQYTTKTNSYSVRFYNWDGGLLLETSADYGSYAIYTGPTPTRDSDNEYAYSWIGWDKDPKSTLIVGETIFTATYSTYNKSNGILDGMSLSLNAAGTAFQVSSYNSTSQYISLVIPAEVDGKPIVAILDGAFNYKSFLQSIVIGPNVKTIGSNAFADCNSLKKVTFSEGLKTIGSQAFRDDPLFELSLPKSLTSLGTSVDTFAFSNCSQIASIHVADGNSVFMVEDNCLLSIADGTLWLVGGQDDTVVRLPKSTKIIAGNAFSSATANGSTIQSVIIDDALVSLGANAFARLSQVASLDFSNSALTDIGERAFGDCWNLSTLLLPSSLTTVSSNNWLPAYSGRAVAISFPKGSTHFSVENGFLYDNGKTVLFYVPSTYSGSLGLPDTLQTISGGLFCNFPLLTGVTFPSSLLEIGPNCFNSCSALVSVSFPDSLLRLGRLSSGTDENSCFTNCDKLESVILGSGISLIASGSFLYDTKLSSITAPKGISGYHVEDNCLYSSDKETLILAPRSYPNAVLSLLAGLKYIRYNAISTLQIVSKIVLPSSLTSIEWGNFDNFKNRPTLYFLGTSSGWNDHVSKQDYGTMKAPFDGPLFYADKKPDDTSVSYWHYDANNVPVAW